MIRNLKALSLALGAMVVMSAALSSAAQATTFTASAGSGSLTGTQTTEQVFTFDAGTARCTTLNQASSFSSASFNEVDFIPAYSGCKAFGFLSATVSTGKCNYEYTGAGQVGGQTIFDIACSSGEITINTVGCVVHIPAQTNLSHVKFSNGAGDLNATMTITGIKYNQTAGCPNGSGVKTNGTLTGESTIKASSGTIQVD
jgi:hypothetical protein